MFVLDIFFLNVFVSDVEKETSLKNLEINIGFKNILTCKWLVFQNCELKYITIILFQSYFFFLRKEGILKPY